MKIPCKISKMKKLLILPIVVLFFGCSSETDEHAEILSVMSMQEKAWSNNNIDEFMEGYWKSDSLKFYGANGLTYGWQQTLDNYKRRYPTADHTGELNFEIDDITMIQPGAYYVMGRYHLKRPLGDAEGVFLIIFKKIDGEWKIIADLSC